MDISIYLVELLRIYDCVIVPELGGFVGNYRCAGVDLARNVFTPPSKELVFNSSLTKNDGLLVKHISESEGIGYLEARQFVAESVEEAWSKLENGEPLKFPQIGTLVFDKNEKLIFEPELSENLLISSYGLSDFHFPKLEREEYKRPITRFEDKDAVRVVFNTRNVKRALVGVPLILALALMPVSKHSNQPGSFINNSASTTPVSTIVDSFSMKMPSEAAKETITEVKTEPIEKTETAPVQEEPTFEAPLTDTKAQTSKEIFYLVGGSFKSKINATKYLNNLLEQGYDSRLFKLKNGFYRVTIESYTAKEEAVLALRNFQAANPGYGIWLLDK